jgi:hypothetical protein
LVGCAEPRVITKTVVIEKPVPVPGKGGETIAVTRQCPPNEGPWRQYCRGFKNKADCNRRNFYYWQGGNRSLCVRVPNCKDKGLKVSCSATGCMDAKSPGP